MHMICNYLISLECYLRAVKSPTLNITKVIKVSDNKRIHIMILTAGISFGGCI